MTSILDGLPQTPEDLAQVMVFAAVMTDEALETRATPGQKQVADLLMDGMPMSAIAGITPTELDAILATGLRQLQVGAFRPARDLLLGLVALQPLESRYLYALGVAQQGVGDVMQAGKAYLQAIALDATNPQIYLRLGECFLGNGELEGARGSFEMAKALVARGHGTRDVVAYADRLLAALPAEPQNA